MIRLACALFFVLSTGARAETILVQSGDHPGFTRLVLAIPSGRDWQLGRQGDGYAVISGDATDTFDTRNVFELITRDRLAALDADEHPGRLNLALACECHATAFRWRSNWVVIDIIDGPASSGSPFETALDGDLGTEQLPDVPLTPSLSTFETAHSIDRMAAYTLTPAQPLRHLPTTPLVLPLVLDGQSDVDLPAILPADQPMPVETASPEAGYDSPDKIRISATEQAIIESFARAASQGLLDVSTAPEQMTVSASPQNHTAIESPGPAPDPDHTGVPMEVPMHDAVTGASSLAGFGLQIVDPDQPGIASHTSFDRNMPPVEQSDQNTSVGEKCLDAKLFDMESWGDDRDFSTQISEKLSALTAEFDVYPEGAVEGLVQSYIYFGLGREALQALMLDGANSQQRRVLAAMAYVVDEDPDPSGLLSSQLGCATQAAIWTTLSRGTLAGTTEAERVAATEGLRALPPMLRGHLGIKLAQIFVDYGDPDTAGTILSAAQDQVTADQVTTAVTGAEITLVTQGAEAAIPVLTSLAEADTRLTPEALVQLINLTLDDGQQLDSNLVTLANSMTYENRGNLIGAELIAAQARALTAVSAYEQVFLLLVGDVTPMASTRVSELRSVAILDLTDKADDAAFLNFAFDALPETGNPAVENAVSARLLALGFADRAGQLLNSAAVGAEARDRKYLEAEIALASGDFTKVEELLGAMSDPRAAGIRARAFAAQGDFAASSSSQNILPGTAADPAMAWRAGEWSVLEQSDDPLLRAASDAVLAPAEDLDPDTPLASSRALLEQATATQILAGQLLNRFAIEPATSVTGSNQ